MAETVRESAADLAEWIAPEIAPAGAPAKPAPSVVRWGFYALTAAAVVLIIAIAWDANAGMATGAARFEAGASAW